MVHLAQFRKLWAVLFGRGSVGRYGVIGVSGATLYFAIFSLLIAAGLIPLISAVISTLVGITNNYTWNSLLNFRIPLSSRRGAKFIIVGLTGLASSAALLQGLIVAGLEPLAAKMLSIPVIALGQFIANKLWTFRSRLGNQ